MKKYIKYIIGALLIVFIAFLGYKLLLSSKNLNQAIILDKKEKSQYTELTVFSLGETKTLTVPNSIKIPTAPAYNIKVKNKQVSSIEASEYYSGEIKSIKDKEIHLENKVIKTTDSTKYYKIEGTEIKEISDKSLIVGYKGYRFIMDSKDRVKYVLVSIPKINRINVLISNYDYTNTNHNKITFKFNDTAEIKGKDINYKFEANDTLTVSKEGNSMTFTTGKVVEKKPTKNSSSTNAVDQNSSNQESTSQTTTGALIGKTSNSVSIIQGDSSKIAITSNARDNGVTPEYYGSFNLTNTDKGIKLINEVYIDKYLSSVVPSEMNNLGGIEGYKVQSIVSRTNAIYDILSKKYSDIGVHVLDSNGSQLYGYQNSNDLVESAIKETSGDIISKDGEIIDAKFYSTSPGFGASYSDVFPNVAPKKDYLVSKSFDYSGKNMAKKSENDLSQYLKDWTIKSYDSNSQYFRWKYSIDYSNISKIVNTNIYNLYLKNPKNFKVKWHFFIYKDATIPKEGIGKVKDIYVSNRNSSGGVTEITIEADKVYKVQGADILKKLLIPSKDFELVTMYGKPVTGLVEIPSSYFTIEKNISGDKFKSITIYGGGEGHGVGLSQNGAIGLSRQGKNYKEIISFYYPECDIVNLDKNFRLEVENRKL